MHRQQASWYSLANTRGWNNNHLHTNDHYRGQYDYGYSRHYTLDQEKNQEMQKQKVKLKEEKS